MPVRAAFFTLGCKVNQYETFALMEQFAAGGFDIVEPSEAADVYVVNSCTVTATGDKKSRQMLRRFRRQSPEAVLVLCGCFPQAFPAEAAAIAEADIVAGTRHRAALLAQVRARLDEPDCAAGETRLTIETHDVDEPFEPMTLQRAETRTRAFVKIEDGCERRCAYCIIPTARGPVRSKEPEALRDEIAALAAAGHREVVLVGINLSCYGRDRGLHLADAVEIACAQPGIERVRLGSLEPELLDAAAIARLARQRKLCPQFHLSLQSGCDATLRRMRRQYNAERYRQIAADLRAAFLNTALTTDAMVAFPGETAEEYAQSEAFVREIGFARAHVFVYSPRPGTPAAEMPEQVDPAEAHRRAKAMAVAARDARAAFLQTQVGRTETVLFETRTADGLWEGYTANYTPVVAPGGDDLEGQLRTVRLDSADGERCRGVLCEDA